MSFKIPILVLCYNRPNKLIKLLKVLNKVQPTKIYFNCDGSRNDYLDLKNTNKVKNIIQHYNTKSLVFTKFHSTNLGCKESIQAGLDFFFKQEKMGIILEDDCIPNSFFFKYCDYLLNKYKNDKKIFAISGFNLLNKKKFGNGDYYLSKYFLCWGWATWRRAWNKSNKKLNFWPQWKKNNFLYRYHKNILETKYWSEIFAKIYKKKIDTWDYYFLASMWKQNAYCLLPNYNLVENIGFDDEATHGKKSFFISPSKTNISRNNIKNPSVLTTYLESDKILNTKLFKIQYFFFPRRFFYIIKLLIGKFL
jgi:hypothetical protein